jgi:glycosyltransferase involved in cell wall biosynthesis
MGMIRVLHIITGLEPHGAENTLLKVVSRMDRGAFTNEVISLTTAGPVAASLRSAGVPVRALGMRSALGTVPHVARLAQWVRAFRPDAVQTWLYHADLLGGVAARLAGCRRVFWNIRHSRLDPLVDKSATIRTARWCARVSGRLPMRVICCSEAARRAHLEIGYAPEKMDVIPNGFDMEQFKPDRGARAAVRGELGLSEAEVAFVLAARFHPVKDHRTLIAAAQAALGVFPGARFVLCGEGIEWSNPELAGAIDSAGVRPAFRLLGKRDDVSRIFAACDVLVSSSISEGFPNTIGEAMACGLPCVVTDAGESAAIVGTTGRVVAPRDTAAMAKAFIELASSDRAARERMGWAARTRVEQNFAIGAIVRRYEGLYRRTDGTCDLEDPNRAALAES